MVLLFIELNEFTLQYYYDLLFAVTEDTLVAIVHLVVVITDCQVGLMAVYFGGCNSCALYCDLGRVDCFTVSLYSTNDKHYSAVRTVQYIAGPILRLRPANERRRYKATTPLIDWVQT